MRDRCGLGQYKELPCLQLKYSESSGPHALLPIPTKLKICSSTAAYKNMLYIPQRLITAFQNWKRANVTYIPDKDPKMISESQSTNPTKSPASYLTFPKEHFVFQQNSPGALSASPSSLTLESLRHKHCRLQGTNDSNPHGSLLSMDFYFPYYLNYIGLLIFFGVHERYEILYKTKYNTTFEA